MLTPNMNMMPLVPECYLKVYLGSTNSKSTRNPYYINIVEKININIFEKIQIYVSYSPTFLYSLFIPLSLGYDLVSNVPSSTYFPTFAPFLPTPQLTFHTLL